MSLTLLTRGWMSGIGPPTAIPWELNRDSVQAPGLDLWWPSLGNVSNKRIFEYIHGLHATEAGTAATWVTDHEGGWVTKNGTTGYRAVADHNALDITDSENFTLTAWVKWEGTTSHGWPAIVGKGNTATFNYAMNTYNKTREIYFTHRPAGAWDDIRDPTASNMYIKDGEWSLAAVRKRGTNEITLYVDGTTYTTNKTIALGTNSLALWMGYSKVQANSYFNGRIGDVRLYKAALSDFVLDHMLENRWDLYKSLLEDVAFVPAVAPAGRIMSSLVAAGGLAGEGGIAGIGGGLAG